MRSSFRSGILGIGLVVVLAWPSALSAGSAELTFTATGLNGAGISGVGLSCSEGGPGSSFWDYRYDAALSGGAFSSLPSSLALLLELRSEAPGTAWLGPAGSSVELENARGSVRLGLVSGECGLHTLAFDGTHASGSGTWAVESATGSYRQATGNGVFNLIAEVGSGADNAFQIQLNGGIAVLDPAFGLEVASAAWEPGTEGGFRHALVTFRIRNTGPGDAFGVSIEDSSTTTPGAEAVGPVPQAVGDIPAGESALAQLRFRFERARPCKVIDRGCALEATLTVEMPDALDQPATHSQTVAIRIPTHRG